MVDRDPESPSADLDATLPETSAQRLAAIENPPSRASIGRVFLFASVAGILAGLASSLAGEVIIDRNKFDLSPPVGLHPSPEELKRWHDAELRVAVATFSVMGALMGLAMGAAGRNGPGLVCPCRWVVDLGAIARHDRGGSHVAWAGIIFLQEA